MEKISIPKNIELVNLTSELVVLEIWIYFL